MPEPLWTGRFGLGFDILGNFSKQSRAAEHSRGWRRSGRKTFEGFTLKQIWVTGEFMHVPVGRKTGERHGGKQGPFLERFTVHLQWSDIARVLQGQAP